VINFVAVGRRAPVDVSAAGIFCPFGDNFPTAAPGESDRARDAGTGSARVGLTEFFKDRIRRLNDAVDSLESTAHANIVYKNPDELHAAAKATSWSPDLAARLEAEAVKLDARVKTRSLEQTNKEIAWSRDWNAFYQEWKNALAGEDLGVVVDHTGVFNSFESQFDDLYARYGKLGYVPPAPRITDKQVEKEHPNADPVGKAVSDIASIVKWSLVGVLLVGGVILVKGLGT
jgi:hypothetical protein